ncbi:hypothetical protein CPB83DRAFT_411643 [Crepidotus variabilis]|uniref:Uncharacterized protein n=1 Tax=Crepidotus variabilis TaxID=179855 RepID=A0A9P6EPX3_9AGAR|nr:hypothetical protein CPB83DRAFT_411643 [Crepidotus variabilis]
MRAGATNLKTRMDMNFRRRNFLFDFDNNGERSSVIRAHHADSEGQLKQTSTVFDRRIPIYPPAIEYESTQTKMGRTSTTMILDTGLSAPSGLLSLPIEVLQDILELAVRASGVQTPVGHPTHGFAYLYVNRKENQKSAYRIRFVCKQIDGVVVKYLFREVKIRLTWNRLCINPPLRELTDGAMGCVFRENARVLSLDRIFLPNPPRFEDDKHRDHEENRNLPSEVWYHYPEPMTKEEKL